MVALESNSHDLIASVIAWLGLIFLLAIIGRYLARSCKQPAVLGELVIGIIFGNFCYYFDIKMIVVLREGATIFDIIKNILAGFSLTEAVNKAIPLGYYAEQVIKALSSKDGIEILKVTYALDLFSRFGVIFLLFMVGLDTSMETLKRTGKDSLFVASIGVLAPIILGFFLAGLVIPNADYKINLFVAATLSATSIGITARVLAEMNVLQTREARTILGAAMLDDVLGLIILGMVTNIVVKGQVDFLMLIKSSLLTILFFVAVLFFSPIILREVIKRLKFLAPWEAKLVVSFLFAMLLAWLATLVQLAAIIGAFLAGMIINDSYFPNPTAARSLSIKELMSPLEFILAPLFFMLIGIQVKLETFYSKEVFFMALGLIIAAILGKLVAGLGASRKADRLFIGLGMLPRGEVGLVFASIGRVLGLISNELFTALILMVIVTTVIVPPLLAYRLKKQGLSHAS